MTDIALPHHVSPVRPRLDTANRSNGSPALTPSPSGKHAIFPGNSTPDISIVPFTQLEVDPGVDRRPGSPSPSLSPISPISPNARRKRTDAIGKRFRAKGGLNLHLNESTLREYTDYDTLGTPRSPFFSPVPWTGNTFGEPDIQTSLERFEDAITQPLPILDVFATSTVRAVLKDPAAVARLRQFTDTSGSAMDIDFLLQIAEFNNSVSQVASTLCSISQRFTGVAASSPVRLPMPLSRNLNGNMREVSVTSLPRLEGLFDNASGYVEQILAQDVYPEFLKHQLSLNLQSIGPCYSPNQVCPGFGEAFCMTEPSESSNPMVYASAGLADLTGYTIGEMVFKDCRMFQGSGTRGSCTDRLRDSLARKEEFTELVLNYTKDGRMFWNLLFMARLVGSDGEVQYHLGGQIDVTEMLERQEDIIHALGYVTPLAERPAEVQAEHERNSWRASPKDKKQDRERDAQHKYPPIVSRNKFLKPFRRRSSQVDSPGTETSSDVAHSEPSTPMESRRSMTFPVSSPTGHHVVVSPYSRFMVLEYIKPSRFGERHDKKMSHRAQLPLAFCSKSALQSFGAGNHTVASVVGQNIFDVLSEKARSPSITKSFKSNVRASLAEGRTAKLDITLGGGLRNRPRGLSISRKHSAVGLSNIASDLPSDHGRSLRRSFSLERLVPGGSAASNSGTAEDFVSYWTPLKNDLGVIQWVVIVLIPEVAWYR